MKKVLIAIDYDPSAQQVAETGYKLGKAINADIILLHVIMDSVYYSSLQYSPVMGFGGFISDTVPVLESVELVKAANGFLERTRTHLGDEKVQIITTEGETTASSILKVAKEIEVDMIVMGSHSRSGLDRILMGSVTEKVLRHSTVPLFLIPNRKQEEQAGHTKEAGVY